MSGTKQRPVKAETDGGDSAGENWTWTGRLRRLAWWAAGATPSVLESCPASEQTKYAALGGAMICVPAIAGVAFGFALHQSFDSHAVAVVGGAFWGILILLVDRLIQISLRKDDGSKKRIFLSALPRLLMIVVLSFLVGDHLLVKILESDIEQQLALEDQQSAIVASAASRSVNATELERLEEIRSALQKDLEHFKKLRDARYEELKDEGAGTGGSKIPGYGKIYARKQAAEQRADDEYAAAKRDIEPKIDRLNGQIDALIEEQSAAVRKQMAASTSARGQLRRNKALWTILLGNPGAFLFGTCFMLAMILLESTPVCAKLLMKRGPYEELLDASESEHKARVEFNTRSRIEAARGAAENSDHRDRSVRSLARSIHDKVVASIKHDTVDELGEREAELARRVRRHAIDEILESLPPARRDLGGPVCPTSDRARAASLIVDVDGPEPKRVQLAFNCPEDAIATSDLLEAIDAIDNELLTADGGRLPLKHFDVVNCLGEALVPTLPLFAQLRGVRLVRLVPKGGSTTAPASGTNRRTVIH